MPGQCTTGKHRRAREKRSSIHEFLILLIIKIDITCSDAAPASRKVQGGDAAAFRLQSGRPDLKGGQSGPEVIRGGYL